MIDEHRVGDRSAAWRSSYLRVNKDPLRGAGSTNRRRLQALDVPLLGPGGRWLDIGAGDGNLCRSLHEFGVTDVVAIEYQHELLTEAPPDTPRVAGSAVTLPVRSDCVDVVILMDVLHHLTADELVPALAETRRVLRPGGSLLVCEPAATFVRTVLTKLLMSPVSGMTQFSRDKRRMVVEESATLEPWLAGQHQFAQVAGQIGFRLERRRIRPLHSLMRFTSLAD